MKERNKFFGKLSSENKKETVEVKVDILEYNEHEIYYAYSPSLDLIGYGETSLEARESRETVLEEYIQYGFNKKTLFKDIESRGWKLKKKNIYTPPTFSWLLENNDGLTDVYNKHDFRKITKPITMPVVCA